MLALNCSAVYIPTPANILYVKSHPESFSNNTLDDSSSSSHPCTFHISYCKYKDQTTKTTD